MELNEIINLVDNHEDTKLNPGGISSLSINGVYILVSDNNRRDTTITDQKTGRVVFQGNIKGIDRLEEGDWANRLSDSLSEEIPPAVTEDGSDLLDFTGVKSDTPVEPVSSQPAVEGEKAASSQSAMVPEVVKETKPEVLANIAAPHELEAQKDEPVVQEAIVIQAGE
jgi:hypothetical protein